MLWPIPIAALFASQITQRLAFGLTGLTSISTWSACEHQSPGRASPSASAIVSGGASACAKCSAPKSDGSAQLPPPGAANVRSASSAPAAHARLTNEAQSAWQVPPLQSPLAASWLGLSPLVGHGSRASWVMRPPSMARRLQPAVPVNS